MKKIIFLITIMLLPLNVYAYSDYVYRGGNTIGIEANYDGVLIVGFYKINGEYNSSNLNIGDYIIKINDVNINSLNELTDAIEKYQNNKELLVTYKRNNEIKTSKLKLILDEGIYKTGLYVKDNIKGIGTLTYIDPESMIYGALGHEIIESNSNKIVDVSTGKIFKNSIISIDKSSVGHAGSKNAKYFFNTVFGSIYKNSNHGIFGKYTSNLDNFELVEVGNINDIKIGKAFIYTVLDEEKVDSYEIDIKSINENSDTKNIVYEIVDKRLIDACGGIVQGMSGSPIMQNNKIIGAVTHVIVDNPLIGYGISITKMLEEGEKK